MDHFLDGLLVILCCLGVDVLLWNNLLSASGMDPLCFVFWDTIYFIRYNAL